MEESVFYNEAELMTKEIDFLSLPTCEYNDFLSKNIESNLIMSVDKKQKYLIENINTINPYCPISLFISLEIKERIVNSLKENFIN